MGSRLEQQARVGQPADRRGVLRGRVRGRPLIAAEGIRLLARDRLHAGQEVVDHVQLGLRVVTDLRRALVADTGHRGLDRGDALRDELDDDAPAIGGVGDATDVAGLLQAVDDAGDRAGRQPHEIGQPAGGGRPAIDEDLERLDIGLREAEPDRDGLPEERPLEVDATQGTKDGIDGFAIHG